MTRDQKKCIAYLRKAAAEAMKEQIAFAEIPCPDWKASARADYLCAALEAAGLAPSRDKVGNVIAVRKRSGRRKRPTLILAAHMDSVFYGIAEIKVQRKGRRYFAPGIGDNAAGVADLILLARAMKRCGVAMAGDVVFVGSTGEEGEGRLRGMRHFWKDKKWRKAWFVSVDGSGCKITRRALASWSPRITVKGPGGHSYGNFGRPNPVHMLSRFVTKMTETLKGDGETDTVFNATVISGGTAVNVIPEEAGLTVNMRSSDPGRLAQMVKTARRLLAEAKREELDWATKEKRLAVRYTALERPGGETAEKHPLVQAAVASLRAEGLKSEFRVSSTDANMPISLGVPAINICAGGEGGNLHSVTEWFENTRRGKSLAALARLVFAVTC